MKTRQDTDFLTNVHAIINGLFERVKVAKARYHYLFLHFNMLATRSPIIVIVPGAFGTPSGFDKLQPFFKEAGLSTYPGAYPSCDPPNPAEATCQNDIASLREKVLLPLIQKGELIVVVAHSYGGVVAGAAAKGLDRETRKAQDQAGGIIGLIYVAGNITLEGEPLLKAVGGAYPPFIKLGKVAFILLEIKS